MTIPKFEDCFVLGLNNRATTLFKRLQALKPFSKHVRPVPDLIIMDLAMPEVSGDEAIVSLKTDPLTRDIPVIVLTAVLHGPLLYRAIAAGVAEILHKPASFTWLELAIRRHLSAQPQMDRVP